MSICILADAADIDRAKIELEYMSVVNDDLKKYVCLQSVASTLLTMHVD